MRQQKGFLFLALMCIAALLASCGQGNGSADSPANEGSEEETTAVKVFDKGSIIRKEGPRLLITAYVQKNDAPYIDAFWFTVNEQTVVQNSEGQHVPLDNISVGAQVEAWHTGTVEESYPAQTAAAKIIVHEDTQEVPEGMVGQTEAVQAALQSQTGSTAASAVKSASLDAENGYWNVELVHHETVDQPVTVRIDARSGEPVPIPVAENEVFRLFSPQPGTETGPTFTVEGEARVFEAAFSWTLEDGHTILAEGHEMADEGAPAWGRFRFDVSYEQASQANMTLILFIHSAKDGSVQHRLIIPLKVPEERIDHTVE
ncbi:Gmad2 immunoglobulin-like domain-containing protein [Paenibacillus beijingensis]|uniref:Gmad2 immunoglobulin-like domain-containing protein n=1 Tax=Paenibacillus beijingensis TaxID=1126833 RepID=UPI00069706F0|nr:Gmad2 immunoglobulin-like domain-containing protein [Paenibacillus beijingensis]